MAKLPEDILDAVLDEAILLEVAQEPELLLERMQGQQAQNTVRGAPPQIKILRELTPSDIQMLVEQIPSGDSPKQTLLRIRHTHHAAAKFLATGMTYTAVSKITGYSPGRISVLMDDPAFLELVHHYRKTLDDATVELHVKMAALSGDMLDEIRHRFENDPEAFTTAQLIRIAEMGADRSGQAAAAGKPQAFGQGQAMSAAMPEIHVHFIQSPHAHEPEPQEAHLVDVTPVKVLP